jgi:hypothetical protein
MVLPHCTIWRMTSVVLVGASLGVPVAGVGETDPVTVALLGEAAIVASLGEAEPAAVARLGEMGSIRACAGVVA